MLNDIQRVRNIAHNVVEELKKDFSGEIFFKIFLDGVKFIIIRKKGFYEIADIQETFVSHVKLYRYRHFYLRCLWLLQCETQNDFIQ